MTSKGRNHLMELLTKLSIETKVYNHPAVFTVDAMMEYLKDVEGVITKNLFLKDKKKKLYLCTVEHTRDLKLNEITKQIGASGCLRFADESVMLEKLGVGQGCCTPLSLINDESGEVKIVVDEALLRCGIFVYSHPLDNTATLGMSSENFKLFLKHTEHDPIVLKFD